jgi:hypothetical protein
VSPPQNNIAVSLIGPSGQRQRWRLSSISKQGRIASLAGAPSTDGDGVASIISIRGFGGFGDLGDLGATTA